jgi:hypothetical protein
MSAESKPKLSSEAARRQGRIEDFPVLIHNHHAHPQHKVGTMKPRRTRDSFAYHERATSSSLVFNGSYIPTLKDGALRPDG